MSFAPACAVRPAFPAVPPRLICALLAVVVLSIPWYLAQRDQTRQPILSGKVVKVIDGDTLDILGVGRVRLVGVNAPEVGERGHDEATEFLAQICLGRVVTVDVDDKAPKDHFDRILAVVMVNGTNVNALLLTSGHAKILHLPPSEFNPHDWE